jgi:hypothetical protein
MIRANNAKVINDSITNISEYKCSYLLLRHTSATAAKAKRK